MSDPLPPPPSAGPQGAGWPNEEPEDLSAPQVSDFDRLWKILVSPLETFRAIAARPSWGAALVLTVVVSVGLWVILTQKIDFVEAMRQQLEQQGQEMPPGAERFAGASKVIYPVGAAVSSIAFALVVAAVMLALNLLGGRLRFTSSLSVVLHSGIPALLKALLSLPVLFARESLTLADAQTGILKSNLAAFASEGTDPRLMVLLASLDVFSIWSIVLMILGYSVVARVSKGKAAALVVGGWAATILFFALLAGLRPS